MASLTEIIEALRGRTDIPSFDFTAIPPGGQIRTANKDVFIQDLGNGEVEVAERPLGRGTLRDYHRMAPMRTFTDAKEAAEYVADILRSKA